MKLSVLVRVTLLLAGLCVAGGAGCDKSPPNEGKMMPRLAPAPGADIPKDLRIEVEVDGQAAAPIDATKLSGIEPEFADDKRKAWRLSTLLGPASSYHASSERGVAVELRDNAEAGQMAILMLSRRGEVAAAVVEEKHPFPDYHGQGGQLGRPGDPLPRVLKVTKIRVTKK